MTPRPPQRRERPWRAVDQRRLTSAERGYGGEWAEASRVYRSRHPLCVNCLLQGRTRGSECVDHVVPIACVPELQWDPDNWAALCWSCHSHKTTQEPRQGWTPNDQRLVICGLPGTGKTTTARELGRVYFDADERGLTEAEQIIAARKRFVRSTRGPCSVIVASTITAAQVAAELRGAVLHLTEVFEARPTRAALSRGAST